MAWFRLLFVVLSLYGFGLLLARIAGWSTADEQLYISAFLLFGSGLTVVVVHLVSRLVERFFRRSLELRVRISLQRSLDNYAALLSISTSTFMVGAEQIDRGEFALLIAGAFGCMVSSFLLVRLLRRYWRWRLNCLRRGRA